MLYIANYEYHARDMKHNLLGHVWHPNPAQDGPGLYDVAGIPSMIGPWFYETDHNVLRVAVAAGVADKLLADVTRLCQSKTS